MKLHPSMITKLSSTHIADFSFPYRLLPYRISDIALNITNVGLKLF